MHNSERCSNADVFAIVQQVNAIANACLQGRVERNVTVGGCIEFSHLYAKDLTIQTQRWYCFRIHWGRHKRGPLC